MNKLLAIFSGKRTLIIRGGIILLLIALPTILYLNRGLFIKACEKCEKCETVYDGVCPIIDDETDDEQNEEPYFYISPEYKLIYLTELMAKPKTSITNFKDYQNTNEKDMIRMVLNKLDYLDQTTKYDKDTDGGYVTKDMFDAATLELFGPEITLDMAIVKNDVQSGESCAIWNYNSEKTRLERGNNGCGGEESLNLYKIYRNKNVETGFATSTVKFQEVKIYQEDYTMDEGEGGATDTFTFYDNGVKIGTLVLSNTGNEFTNRQEVIENYLTSIENKINTYVYTYTLLVYYDEYPAFTKYEIIK